MPYFEIGKARNIKARNNIGVFKSLGIRPAKKEKTDLVF